MLIWVHLCLLVTDKKAILILGKVPTQVLDDTKITAEKEFCILVGNIKDVV